MKLLIIYELSMVSRYLWKYIDSKLGEISRTIAEIAFAGFSVMTVADLLQLPLIRGKLTFSQFSDKEIMKYLLGLQLLHLFKYAELTEVVRHDKLFIDFINKV